MSTPNKTTPNMRKHLTKAERAARESAEKELARQTRVTIHAPKWLSVEARKIFDSTKHRMRGLKLLDNIDADLLALYSDAIAHYRTEAEVKDKQAWSRIALSYAEKLGISASSRARLAKKRAEQTTPDELEQLFDDVKEFVNRGDV
jgi:phage terminase small subunit